jgi:Protein of unknown function (DUF559)
VQAGLPRPQTQIAVLDEFRGVIVYLDMGWEDVKIAVEYDGEQHRSDRRQYTWDIRRLEMLERLGWIVIGWSRGTGPPRSSAACARLVPVERDATVAPGLERDCSVTFGC